VYSHLYNINDLYKDDVLLIPVECMSHVRHVLQSVECPAITNVRASDDYHPGNEQWNVGTSSILAHALGVAPSKDNYWCVLFALKLYNF
jgi:hypothetical protein